MTIPQTNDDDLFQPTLTSDDDVAGFEEPWDPTSLTFLTFFAGPLAGGALFAANFKRLGQPSRFVPTLMIVAAVSLPSYALIPSVVTLRYAPFDARGKIIAEAARTEAQENRFRSARRTGNLVLRLIGICLALALAAKQKSRFRLCVGTDHPTASLWATGVIAFFVGRFANRAFWDVFSNLATLGAGA